MNLSNWHVLKALLLVAPNLKVLVLDKVSLVKRMIIL